MNGPLNMIVHNNLDETKKQRDFITTISKTLEIDQPGPLSKTDASDWISEHYGKFKHRLMMNDRDPWRDSMLGDGQEFY